MRRAGLCLHAGVGLGGAADEVEGSGGRSAVAVTLHTACRGSAVLGPEADILDGSTISFADASGCTWDILSE